MCPHDLVHDGPLRPSLRGVSGLSTAPQRSTYALDFDGTSVDFLDAWECPMQNCGGVFIVRTPWSGTLTLTAPDGDGTFTFDETSVPRNLTLTLGDSAPLFLAQINPSPLFGVVISGGHVASLFGTAHESGGPATWSFDGMEVSFFEPAGHHYGMTISHELITAAVPEPQTWALLLAGLVSIGGLAGKRRVLLRRRSKPMAIRRRQTDERAVKRCLRH